MSVLVPPCIAVLTSVWWLVQQLFFGGFVLAKWLAWLTWPVWASIIALGTLAGFLSPR
jgi:hypothetical protein